MTSPLPIHGATASLGSEGGAIALRALEDTVGPAVVLDAELRIAGWSSRAEALLDGLRVGVPITRVLCGEGEQRPVAEALAAGRAVSAEVPRPGPAGAAQVLHVRASPLAGEEGGAAGWLVVLEATPGESTADGEAVVMHGMWTRSPAMKKLFRDVARVARRETTVLVRGETGTGKELVARALHDASPRREGPFRAINCAALPPNLLESELFGHVRGAFTGAVRDALGHFQSAAGGTIFLDEIAELSLELQAKLLRVLQERTVIPVGGRKPVPIDVRLVSATHASLRARVREGRFRADLMYRIRVVPLFLPPLRDRQGDVELLLHRFLDQLGDDQRRIAQVSAGALLALEAYDWPGNVRELQNVVEYALAMGEGPVLSEADLPPELLGQDPAALRVNVPGPIDALPSGEARRIARALERAAGHRGNAARILGISRSTLWRRMREHGLLEDAALDDAALEEDAEAPGTGR